MNLEDDSFEIACWEQFAKLCIEQGKMNVFKKKISEYIWITNRPYREEIMAHAWRRKGEIDRETVCKTKRSPDME